MWKKVVSLFLIICLLATLVGCGGNPVVPPTDEEEGTAGVFESDSSGNLQYYDPLINKEVKISIIDNNSKEPVPGIQIFIFNNGEKIWVYSNDPSGKYFPSFYCEEITKLKQEKSLTLIITLAVIACIGPMVVAIIMQISENAQFFPDEKGYDKIVKTGKLEDILSAMETNNWKIMQIGPEVLTKLGMESEPYRQYAELFSGNDAEKWKEELLDQGLSEHDTYQYGYYQINNNFAEHYVDIVGGDSLANWVDHQNDMTIVYLIDLKEEILTPEEIELIREWGYGGDYVVRWPDGYVDVYDATNYSQMQGILNQWNAAIGGPVILRLSSNPNCPVKVIFDSNIGQEGYCWTVNNQEGDDYTFSEVMIKINYDESFCGYPNTTYTAYLCAFNAVAGFNYWVEVSPTPFDDWNNFNTIPDIIKTMVHALYKVSPGYYLGDSKQWKKCSNAIIKNIFRSGGGSCLDSDRK